MYFCLTNRLHIDSLTHANGQSLILTQSHGTRKHKGIIKSCHSSWCLVFIPLDSRRPRPCFNSATLAYSPYEIRISYPDRDFSMMLDQGLGTLWVSWLIKVLFRGCHDRPCRRHGVRRVAKTWFEYEHLAYDFRILCEVSMKTQ